MENKRSSNGWVRIAKVRSESDAGQWYIIGLRALKTGPNAGQVELGCDCKSRIFKKGTLPAHGFAVTCKHGRALMEGTVALSNLDLNADGIAFLDARKALLDCANDTERNVKALLVCKSKGALANVG
jgi:hypothetical protein